MKLSIGIVGLPNVGKSTLFKLLTKQEVVIANYPFATIDPNVGVVSVPDERLDALAELSLSKERIPAAVEFYDIAGLVKGANKGEGLGNQFLAHIREVAVIVHVVRVFREGGITHVEETVDPVRDIETIHTELMLKDLETVNRRILRAERDAKAGDKEKEKELKLLLGVRARLDAGELLNDEDKEVLDAPAVKETGLLTAKPEIVLFNGEAADIPEELLRQAEGRYLVMNLGADPDISALIRRAYEVLGLISFFTTGEKETRAWTIRRGARAPEAAGVIHTDFEEKFIRAEVIYWEKLIEARGWQAARQKGLIRTEGREYEVGDGDVLLVRHG